MAKTHSLFDLKSDRTRVTKPDKSDKPKQVEKLDVNKQKPKTKSIVTKPESADTNTTNKSTSNQDTICWHKTTNKLPDENRPIMFNSDIKKTIYGYRINNSNYILNDAYHVDKFKKKYGYIEWAYIKGCINLNNCNRGFPNCNYCKFAKSLKKG